MLSLGAGSIALLHALAGPDHYLPFIALARARRWSRRRLLSVTALCGAAHVAASLLICALVLSLGRAAGLLERIETVRGEAAAWTLLGFGIAYTVWGIRRAARGRRHTHWHAHADGRIHRHPHDHRGEHGHLHDGRSSGALTSWGLFLVFVLGPCEPLIPLLLYAAGVGGRLGVSMVAVVFGIVTVSVMSGVVLLGVLGLSRLRLAPLERYGHAAAGLTLVACALALRFGL